jgi:hypothetical protein
MTCPKKERKGTAKRHNVSVRHHTKDQTIPTIYTDGSKTKEGTGASFIAYHKGHAIHKKPPGMGNYAEAFDTEKWALTKTIAWVIKYTTKHLQKQIKTFTYIMLQSSKLHTT